MTPTPDDLEVTRETDTGSFGNALWRIAMDTFVKTILIVVMGNVALGILGGIFSEMIPSSPPFLPKTSGGHTNPDASLMHTWWSAAHEHQFAIVYVILFALGARARLFPATDETATTETRFQKISDHFSRNWFRLIVGNAFGALISAIVIYFVENFTGTRILIGLLLAAILPGVKAVATFIFGSTIVNFVDGMFDWYGNNQLRFNFWILYVGAVCDDLGIPNLKTLARFLWSRWRRTQSAQPVDQIRSGVDS
jgi:hypothetical protein